MATFNQFRAGSGSYQQIVPLILSVSSVPAYSLSVETYSTPVTGSLTGLTVDSLSGAQADSASGFTSVSGLVLQEAQITATGVLQLTWQNFTGAAIAPGNIQIDLLVF